jgi:1-acyl-sn-glycerol-3-phosphate acyltransferase
MAALAAAAAANNGRGARSFGAAFVFYPFLLVAFVFSKAFQPKTMRAVDWVVHAWSRAACLLMTYRPRITGMENLPPKGTPVSCCTARDMWELVFLLWCST